MIRISRRKLLKMAAAATLLPHSAGASVSGVYLVRTTDRADGIRRGVAALGLPSVRGRRVAIKPNLNSADPFPASTHLDTLSALIGALRQAGAGELVVADRSGMGETRRVMERKGLFSLATALDFRAVVLDELAEGAWQEERLPGGHWSRGVLFAAPFRDADLIVQTCCLKTHRYGGHFTLSLKNSVGMVAKLSPRDRYDYMRELHAASAQRRMIAELNQLYRPALVVMDGLEAFTDGGPDTGTLVAPQLMLLGSDRIAMDAVGVAILRMHGGNATISRGRIFDQEQIAHAVRLGVGVADPRRIDLVTDDPESRKIADRIRGLLA